VYKGDHNSNQWVLKYIFHQQLDSMAAALGLAGKSPCSQPQAIWALIWLPASVIAVLQLTTATISTFYSYGTGVKNASKEKKQIIDQLLALQKVLEDVRALAEEEESKASPRLPALIELFNQSHRLLRCRAELDTLKATLETRGRRTDRMKALIWPFKEGEVKKTLDNLRQFQQLLSSTLSVDQVYVPSLVPYAPYAHQC
jgi:hypothetical protein